jgi:predicted MPP superfamily phosphohydrolase
VKITEYTIKTEKIKNNLCIATVSDLHARAPQRVLSALREMSPDMILLPGDILEVANEYMSQRNENSLLFFREAVKIAPCYYCFGNHEIYYSHAAREKNRVPNPDMLAEIIKQVKGLGVNIVNDSYTSVAINDSESILIGGLVCGQDTDPSLNQKKPNLVFLDEYSKKDGYKILLCHYPHYYDEYLKKTDFDLILSGHAHGGHWRFFERGIYAPHQGLLPKYTHGMHFGRFIISTGAVNNTKPIPRFFNAPEILKITIQHKEMP